VEVEPVHRPSEANCTLSSALRSAGGLKGEATDSKTETSARVPHHRSRRRMNRKVVTFRLPPAGQFSAAVDIQPAQRASCEKALRVRATRLAVATNGDGKGCCDGYRPLQTSQPGAPAEREPSSWADAVYAPVLLQDLGDRATECTELLVSDDAEPLLGGESNRTPFDPAKAEGSFTPLGALAFPPHRIGRSASSRW
jgi:hypothetical protein